MTFCLVFFSLWRTCKSCFLKYPSDDGIRNKPHLQISEKHKLVRFYHGRPLSSQLPVKVRKWWLTSVPRPWTQLVNRGKALPKSGGDHWENKALPPWLCRSAVALKSSVKVSNAEGNAHKERSTKHSSHSDHCFETQLSPALVLDSSRLRHCNLHQNLSIHNDIVYIRAKTGTKTRIIPKHRCY